MPKVYLRNIGGYYFDDEYSSMSSPKVRAFLDCFDDDVTKLVVSAPSRVIVKSEPMNNEFIHMT